MYTLKVWNSAKIENLTGVNVENYKDLIELEDSTGESHSSVIITDCVDTTIRGIYNETDVLLNFEVIA